MIPNFVKRALDGRPASAQPAAGGDENRTATGTPWTGTENNARIPKRWMMAVRPGMKNAADRDGNELCEWQLIATHDGSSKKEIELGMFWWHATTEATQEALAEIGALITKGMPHTKDSAGYIAHLYERYGMMHGPAEAMITIDNIGIRRAIPDSETSHFQLAIDVLPDPELERKNRKLETWRRQHEASFNVSIDIEDGPTPTGIAVYSRSGTGTSITVRTTTKTEGKPDDESKNGSRNEKLVEAVTRELMHLRVPPTAIATAIEVWRSR